MKRELILLAAAAALALPAYGQSQSTPGAAPVGATADHIARESDVQGRVSDEMTHLVRELGELVDDVESNQAYKQADGGTLAAVKTGLASTEKQRVRVAAFELRKATADQAARGAHVKEAATQVNHAKTELTELLRKANALMVEEAIVQEILDIERQQQALARKTAQAGREQLQQQPLSTEPAELANQQRQIARRVKKLEESLDQALKEELTDKARERLQQAQKTAEEKQLDPTQQKAVDDLDKAELTEAFPEQQQSLATLAEMADKLSDVQRPKSEAAAEDLKNLLEEQKSLREKTEAMSPEEFAKEAGQLQLDQLNLAKEAPEDSEAASEMAEAASDLEKSDKDAAVAAQMEAEAALTAAMEDEDMGPGPGVPGAKGKAGTDDKGDGDGDKDKEGRGNKGKGKKGQSKKPGSPPGNQPPKEKGEPSPNAPPSENATLQPALAQNMPTRTPADPKPGQRQFEKTKIEGKAPEQGDSTWNSLSRKERDALNENFARELPPEYRDMLKVYFEELSK